MKMSTTVQMYHVELVSDSDDDDNDDSERVSSVSDCSVEMEEIEIESRVPEIRVQMYHVELVSDSDDDDDDDDSGRVSSVEMEEIEIESRDCRICHLGLESGVLIELGCSCTGDLASAHKHCAETWFKIKRNRTCEICHSVTRNVRIVGIAATSTISITAPSSETPTL